MSQTVYWDEIVEVTKKLRKEYEWIDQDLSNEEFAVEVAKDNATLDRTIDGGKLTIDDRIEVKE